METSGIVIDYQEQSGISKGGKNWKKAIVVLEYLEGTTAKNLALELFGEDKVNACKVKKGDEVTAQYSVESSEYQGRWYTQAKAWYISPIKKGATTEPTSTPAADDIPEMPTTESSEADLPF